MRGKHFLQYHFKNPAGEKRLRGLFKVSFCGYKEEAVRRF